MGRWWFPYVFSVILGGCMAGGRVLWDGRLGGSPVINLETLDKLLNTKLVGSTPDTYVYLVSAYGFYRFGLPVIKVRGKTYWVCARPLSSLPMALFMKVGGKFFPIAYILFFSISTMILFTSMFQTVGIHPKLSYPLITLAGFFVFPYITRIMLEPPVVTLILAFIICVYKERYTAASIFLSVAGILRGEYALMAIVFFIFIFWKNYRPLGKVYLLMPAVINFSLSSLCGDQSNFYCWTHNAYKGTRTNRCVENIQKSLPVYYFKYFYPYFKSMQNCCKEKFFSEALSTEHIPTVGYNVIKNLYHLVFSPTNKYVSSRVLGKFSIIFVIFFWFYALVILLSLSMAERRDFIVFSYITLLILYSAFFPFGMMDYSRFKQYVFPFEIYILSIFIRSLE